jgi:ubiquinone/menaquinone biosynthesis C-methylase UbiE
VPYEAYARFHQVMAEESEQSVVAGLDQHVLPLVPGLVGRLREGLDVLDLGCGSGRALLHLARRFPRSRFTGFDLEAAAIEAARGEARRARLENVRFEVRDAARLDEERAFDLVTTFDAIHDQARPDLALAGIRRALRPGGTYLMQEIKARAEHADNASNPLAAFLYAISCMHCMAVSLAHGGMGLGACWGRETALRMLAEAGFREVSLHELEHDLMNDWYVAR